MNMQKVMAAPKKRTSTHKLPFEFNIKSLEKWLKMLTTLPASEALKNFYCALLEFQMAPIEQQQRFIFLQHFDNYARTIIEPCLQACLLSGFPLAPEKKYQANKIISIYQCLNKNYADIYEAAYRHNESWRSDDIAWMLYLVLKTASKVALYSNYFYRHPPRKFWSSCYWHYAQAEQNGVLDHEIWVDEWRRSSINTIFKKILLFEICQPHQLTSDEMQTLYITLKEISVFASISDRYHDSYSYFLDMDSDRPPQADRAYETIETWRRYLHVNKVMDALYLALEELQQQCGHQSNAKKSLQIKILTKLGGLKKRKFTRVPEQSKCTGLIGIIDIASHLGVPIESVISLSYSGFGALEAPQTLAQARNDFEIVNRSVLGYSLIRTDEQAGKIKINAPIGIIDPHSGILEIGQIIRISQWDHERINLAIQILSLHSEIVTISFFEQRFSHHRGDDAWAFYNSFENTRRQTGMALMLPAIKNLQSFDSIIPLGGVYRTGQPFIINRDDQEIRCHLGRLIRPFEIFNQFELIYL